MPPIHRQAVRQALQHLCMIRCSPNTVRTIQSDAPQPRTAAAVPPADQPQPQQQAEVVHLRQRMTVVMQLSAASPADRTINVATRCWAIRCPQSVDHRRPGCRRPLRAVTGKNCAA